MEVVRWWFEFLVLEAVRFRSSDAPTNLPKYHNHAHIAVVKFYKNSDTAPISGVQPKGPGRNSTHWP